MSCLSHVASYSATIFRGTRNFIARSNLHNQSYTPRRINSGHLGVKYVDLEFLLTRFHIQCYSSRSSGGKKTPSRKLKTESEMDQGKDEFFVVRKGDVVGVYKSLSECQGQVGSSICHPPVSVYKGYSLPKGTEEYLTSHGLKNALYTIRAADLTEDLFGLLMPCTFQEPTSKKRQQDTIRLGIGDELDSMTILADPLRKHVKLDHDADAQAAASRRSCVIEFDGASKGNPGPAGAAAVLRTVDGSLICKLREGLGIATCNVAEYRALILGLKYALQKGYFNIHVRGDSKLVCMQVVLKDLRTLMIGSLMTTFHHILIVILLVPPSFPCFSYSGSFLTQVTGSWKTRHPGMADLCGQAKRLKDKFLSFQITHVLRNLNSEADAQANLAVSLADGQVAEECAVWCK